MIVDAIRDLERYRVPFLGEIAAFLMTHDLLQLPVGETEIMGRDLFVRIADAETRPSAEGRFETHRVYADLQYVVRGEEIMQLAPGDVLTPLTEYDVPGDYQFWSAAGSESSFLVRSGEFVIFWPGEAHRPSCSPGERPVKVKKLVFKIRVQG